jgi:hypothetical protein
MRENERATDGWRIRQWGTSHTRHVLLYAAIAVTIGIGFAVVGAFPQTSLAGERRIVAPSGGSHLQTDTSWTSYYAAWRTPNDVNASGTGCSYSASTYHEPAMTTSSSGIVATPLMDAAPSATSPCTSATMSASDNAGTMACIGSSCPSSSTYFAPTSTGYYTFTATWEFSLSLYVQAFCPGAVSGNSLSDYAEINVTPFMAIYNQSMPDGWVVPNTLQSAFHLDTRDLSCVKNAQGLYVIILPRTFTKTFTETTFCYLQSGAKYEPRAGMDMQMFVVSTSTYDAAAYYQSSNYPTNNNFATLTSIAVS